jgi:rSAM/selenodomain-associated transferase 1
MLFLDQGERVGREGLCGVAIMAKASRAGRCKTRLVPPLSFDEAAALNTAFLRDIGANIAAAAERAPIQGMAAYHPAGEEAFFDPVLPADFRLVPPREAGLGRSLPHAARDILNAGYGSMCLVNSDSPTLPPAYLVEAARLLAEPGDRVVLGPAADGGYYLIGLKIFHPRLFEDIDWSTERVFGQTVERAREIGLPVAALPPWYDVDEHETLALLLEELFQTEAPTGYRGGNPAPHSREMLRDLRKAGLSRRLDALTTGNSCAS